jgi:anti-anti-sigma regulatory factor
MFQVRRSADKGAAILALSGRIDEGDIPELERLLATEAESSVVLDLADIRLVSREAVRFLAACEARGIGLRNCPPYVREWIATGKGKRHEP